MPPPPVTFGDLAVLQGRLLIGDAPLHSAVSGGQRVIIEIS